MLISLAKQYPGSVIGIGRKNTTEMKRGTMMSFDEAAMKMNVTDYRENRNDMTWRFSNGSKFIFFEIDRAHDRDFSKIKSMNLTAAMIDEADAVEKDGFLSVYGRVGRANENGAPDFLILACNPNEAWIKEDYYDKYQNGLLPPDAKFIEFEIGDSFLGSNYYSKFDSAPENWKKRYLYNDWNYGDDEHSLFKYQILDGAHIMTLADDTRYAALDVARFGTDRSVAAIWQGKQLYDIRIMKDKDEKITNPDLARKFKTYCEANSVGYTYTCVDAVGNGGGVVDTLHELGFYAKSFIAGSAATGNYNNIRSESTHILAQDFEKGVTKIFNSCPYIAELKKELTMQNYEIKDKQLVLESKEKIKQRLGMSPDVADAVIMAYSMQIDTGMLSVDDIAL